MACPYFYPIEEARFDDRPRPARSPLGAVCTGECHADPASIFTPAGEMLFEFCNFGNARDACPRFPASAEADAVRFTEWNSAVIYVLEKDCSPIRHGRCDGALDAPVLARQAAIFSRYSCSMK